MSQRYMTACSQEPPRHGSSCGLAFIAVIVALGCDSRETHSRDAAIVAKSKDAGSAAALSCKALAAQAFDVFADWNGDTDGIDISKGYAVTGTVQAVFAGWPDSRRPDFGGGTADASRGWRFRVSDATHSVWIGLILPWRAALVAVGDQVSVSYHISPHYAFEPPAPSMLTIRDRDGGLVFWAGQTANTQMLAPPDGFTIDDAADPCVYDDGCGSVKRRGFVLEQRGRETELGYGARASFERYVALHAGNDQANGGPEGRCGDWWVANSSLALIRGSIESLSQSESAFRDGGAADAAIGGDASAQDDAGRR